MVWTKIYIKTFQAQIEEILRDIEPALENMFLKKNLYSLGILCNVVFDIKPIWTNATYSEYLLFR